MPVQVVPHMYRMLVDELQAAVAQVSLLRPRACYMHIDQFASQNQSYNFSHLLFFSRIYRLTPEEEAALNAQSTPSQNKRRRAQQTHLQSSTNGVYSFHHEDPIIQKVSI